MSRRKTKSEAKNYENNNITQNDENSEINIKTIKKIAELTKDVILDSVLDNSGDDNTSIIEGSENIKNEQISSNNTIKLGDIPKLLQKFYELKHSIWRIYFNYNNSENRVFISVSLFSMILLYPLLMRVIWGLIGFVCGYQFFFNYERKIEKNSNIPKIARFRYKNYNFHHWICCLSGIIALWNIGYTHPVFMGFLFGGISHGIQRSDWYKIKN